MSRRLILAALTITIGIIGCSEKVDLANEKSPDATGAPAPSAAVSQKPNTGFQKQAVGSDTGLK